MKILITSDLQGQTNDFEIIAQNETYDVHFDLGNNAFNDEFLARHSIISLGDIANVNGTKPSKRLIDLLNFTVYLTNGVQENVHLGLEMLTQKATEYKADLILYPASQQGKCLKKGGKMFFPVPRFSESKSYLLIELDEQSDYLKINNMVERYLA